jgi:serine/threonine protein kinase
VRATDPRANNRTVAVKRLKHVFDTTEVAQRVLNEIRLLRALGVHQNVTSLHALLSDVGATEDNFNTIYMVLEAAHSDLFKILNSTVVLRSEQVRSITHQTLTALSWLHSNNVIHCDVKPANLLVDADCRIRLADFGLSRWSSTATVAVGDNKQASAIPSTSVKGYRFLRVESMVGDDEAHSDQVALECCYRSPEVLWPKSDSEPYRASLDIWSVGCVFAELLRAMKAQDVNQAAENVDHEDEEDEKAVASRDISLPLDSTGRILGGHQSRSPLFALKEVPSWLSSMSNASLLQTSSQSSLSQEDKDAWTKSPTGRRSRSPRPEVISSFSSDSRRVLGSFLHVLGTEGLSFVQDQDDQDETTSSRLLGAQTGDEMELSYLSSGARMFVYAALEQMGDPYKPNLDIDPLNNDGSLELLKHMLTFNPLMRPSANAALDHP